MAGDSGSDAAVSPDGRWVAFGVHSHGVVRVFEAATGRPVLEAAGGIRCLFTPDGRWLATDADGGRFYAVGTWEPGTQLGPGSLQCVSADSRLAVLAMTDGYYRLVDVETGRELVRIEDPERYPGLATLTPDGTGLVALTKDGVRVWDLRAIRRELSALGLDWDALPYSPEPPVADAPGSPLQVEVVGAELLNPTTRAWWTLIQSTRRLLEAPDDRPARQRRAAAAQQLGWPGLATHDYSSILEQHPDHRAARFQRGLIALQQRRPTDALADFDDLLRRDPEYGPARYRRAWVLIALERYREAAADLDWLIPKYPQDASLYGLRGQCRDRLGDRAGAGADVRKAVELLPEDPSAANNLAWRLVTGPEHLRDPVQALALAEKAVRLTPQQWMYHNTLGVVLYRLGRYAEAVKPLSASLAHAAAESAAYDLYFLAMCHHRLGDAAKAKDCFDRAVRWQPKAKLSSEQVEELNAFRAEAAALLGAPPIP
jgi:tetratricopeptide (TPR) repeat protein